MATPAAWFESLPPSLRRRAWVLVLPVLVLAAVLRVPGLDDYWLNPDEGIYYSVMAWQNPEMRWAEIAANAHPPLFYLLLRAMSGVAVDPVWLRSSAAVFGLVAVLGIYLLGREVAGRGLVGELTGLGAAVMLAVSPAAIVLSQVIRPYTLQLSLLVFGLFGLAHWWRCRQAGGPRGRLGLGAYAVCVSLAFLTHYSSVFVFGAVGVLLAVALVARRVSRPMVRELAVAHALPVLVGLGLYFFHVRPQLAGTAVQEEAFATWLRPYLADSLLDVWRSTAGLVIFAGGERLTGLWLGMLLLGVAVAARRRAVLIWLAPAVAVGLAALASWLHKYPFGATRHSAYLFPFVLIPMTWLLAVGITSGRIAAIATVAGLTALLGLGNGAARSLSVVDIPTTGEEQVTPHELVEQLMPALEEVKASPGLVVTDEQGYYTLVRLFEREREHQRVVDEIRRFTWGRREVVVHPVWWFTVDPTKRDSPRHLYNFVRTTEAVMPDLRLREQRSVVLLLAGFGSVAMDRLKKDDDRRPPAVRLIRRYLHVTGVWAAEFDLARFAAEQQALDRRGR